MPEDTMRRSALLCLLLAGACASPDALDGRMKPMVGASEPALLAAMGRPPDLRAQPAPGVTTLQWRWRQPYAIPDRLLAYSYGGGAIKPIAHTATGIVQDECVAEWTVQDGVATAYRWQGDACAAAAERIGSPDQIR
jgi:hypothetical protein